MAFALTSNGGQQSRNNLRGNLPLPFPLANAPLAPENNKPRLQTTTVKLGNDVTEAGGVRSSFLPRATVSHFCLLFAVRWTGSASLTTSTSITCVSRVNMSERSNCEMRTFRVGITRKLSVDVFYFLLRAKRSKCPYFARILHVKYRRCVNLFDLVKENKKKGFPILKTKFWG